MTVLLTTTDDDIRLAPLVGLVRLASWLGIDADPRPNESDRAVRWRLGRAIQREEKRLSRLPKPKER